MKRRNKAVTSQKDKDVILILDDEPHHVNWLVEYLWHKNYRVELTLNLADAVKKIQANRYRLVILDLSVPLRADWRIRLAAEGDVYVAYPGLFAAHEARNLGQRARQVVVYSVHDSSAVREITNKIGVEYITKGRPKIFKREIDDILSYDPTARRRRSTSK